MGLKRRSGNFTGTLRVAVLRALKPGEKLSKKELLARLRQAPNLKVSIKRLTASLSKLLSKDRVVMDGTRAKAKFHRK